MEIAKELKDISLPITEPEYRKRPELSYSTLSTYERSGFDNLDHLFDKVESPSLLFGSIVDTILTDGMDAFNEHYIVLDINVTDGGKDICNKLLELYPNSTSFEEIPEEYVSYAAKEAGFWKADKWDKIRYREVLKTGNVAEYFNALVSSDKTVIDTFTYNDALKSVNALRTSPATQGYFADNDSMSPVRRYYQLKFAAKFEGVGYRCMMDLAIVDYEDKKIIPCDLKTSGKPEWHFMESFKQWQYLVQSRLYWRILKANLINDPYFKDFTLENYRFIVVNRKTLTPLVWEFPLTKTVGTLIDNEGKEFRDPFVIGKELQGYLNCRPRVPNGIDVEGINTIDCLKLKE
jgi:hypothetical protein